MGHNGFGRRRFLQCLHLFYGRIVEAPLILRPHFKPLELAAGGAMDFLHGDDMRHLNAHQRRKLPSDGQINRQEFFQRAFVLAEHQNFFIIRLFAVNADDGHHAFGDVRKGINDVFQIVRVVILPANKQNVLHPACNRQPSCGNKSQIASFVPARNKCGLVCRRMVIIPACQVGPSDLYFAKDPFRHDGVGRIDNPDADSFQRVAFIGKLDDVVRILGFFLGNPLRQHFIPVDTVDQRLHPQRVKRYPQRHFRRSVSRKHGFFTITGSAELPEKLTNDICGNRLRAVADDSQAGKIELIAFLLRNIVNHPFQTEIGRADDGRLMPGHLVHKNERPANEHERMHFDLQNARIQHAHMLADKPHIVGMRQPAAAHIFGRQGRADGNLHDVGDNIAVGNDNPLGIARAA